MYHVYQAYRSTEGTLGTCIFGPYPLSLFAVPLNLRHPNQCISIPRKESPICNSIAPIGDSFIRKPNALYCKIFLGIPILFTESGIGQGGIPMRISAEQNPFNYLIKHFSFITAVGSLYSEPYFYIYKRRINYT